jgi:mannosyltransferase OCH1-like enzyme
MIPKKIHYCWFGRNSMPKLAKKCLESWKKKLPDYEIKEWNEDNFDVNIIQYTKEAYEAKKYAFVSDYARFKILHDEGGIYLDTDVEVLRNFDEFLVNESFTGFENIERVAPGLILGAKKNNTFIKEMYQSYNECHFINYDGTMNTETIVDRITTILIKRGLILNGKYQQISNLSIYPVEYFSPKSYETGKINLTSNTYSIHHFAASWKPRYQKTEKYIWNLLGLPNYQLISRFKNKLIKEFKSRI